MKALKYAGFMSACAVAFLSLSGLGVYALAPVFNQLDYALLMQVLAR